MEALLDYYSCFILSGGLVLSSYTFPLLILLTNGKRLALVPTYQGSLSERLNECVPNVARFRRHYNGSDMWTLALFKCFSGNALGPLCPNSLSILPRHPSGEKYIEGSLMTLLVHTSIHNVQLFKEVNKE